MSVSAKDGFRADEESERVRAVCNKDTDDRGNSHFSPEVSSIALNQPSGRLDEADEDGLPSPSLAAAGAAYSTDGLSQVVSCVASFT